MLSENIRRLRKAKGLSQEELAVKLNVVRQTVSKWEQGLSVPDADLLLALSDALETPVGTLLGETVSEAEPDELKALSQKLEVINLQLAREKEKRRKVVHGLFIALAALVTLLAAALFLLNSPYLVWDNADPERAVFGAAFHVFEWIFVRLAPVVLIGAIVGIVLTRKKRA